MYVIIGSGVWLQQQNTYIQVEERQDISLIENRIVICINSKGVLNSADWYFLGEDTTGEGTLISDMIERDNTRGFLKLTTPISIPTSKLGYYYRSTKIYTDLYVIQSVRHTIRIYSTQASTPTTPYITTQKTTTPLNIQTTFVPSTTTTTMNSIPSIQIKLSYTH